MSLDKKYVETLGVRSYLCDDNEAKDITDFQARILEKKQNPIEIGL